MKERGVMVSCRMPPALISWLDSQAGRRGLNRSAIIIKLLQAIKGKSRCMTVGVIHKPARVIQNEAGETSPAIQAAPPCMTDDDDLWDEIVRVQALADAGSLAPQRISHRQTPPAQTPRGRARVCAAVAPELEAEYQAALLMSPEDLGPALDTEPVVDLSTLPSF